MEFSLGGDILIDFIWAADLVDGTTIKEITKEGKRRPFRDIPKNKLVTFGLIGQGMKFYYDASNGIFNLDGRIIEMSYIEGNKEYPLTGYPCYYNDPISFKQSYTDINPFTGAAVGGGILQYTFGYKTQLKFNDVNINFKPIVHLPMGGKVFIKIRLVADRDMSGNLRVYRNGKLMDDIPMPLQKMVGAVVEWVVR